MSAEEKRSEIVAENSEKGLVRDGEASIYVHIPFCARKCAYCDFASWANRGADIGRYFDALGRQAEAAREKYGRFSVPSVYIGGGTPTVAPADALCGLLESVFRLFSVQSDAEITVEANPGTLTLSALRALRRSGANRLSIGAQAFQPELLRMLGRIHSAEQIASAVDLAREAGFDNLSLDLMYALPGQTIGDWRASLDAALSLGVSHVSCYSLILEPGTPLAARVDAGEIRVPGEEEALLQQREAARALRAFGLERYEISNYALPGYESRHNRRYWTRGEYLGLGCAAHSLMGGARFHAPETLDGYLALSGAHEAYEFDKQTLSPEEEREEAILLETRMTDGVDLAAYRARYGVDFWQERGAGARELISLGLAQARDNRFRLTDAGLDVQNAAVLALVSG